MNNIHEFIISVLDDNEGVSKDSYISLCTISEEDPTISKIISLVDEMDDRYFLGETTAKELRKELGCQTQQSWTL